ncbi:hypothetical protein Vadar_013206 [Vaccinium darrowii]|uniref:Uncharacterized protein n=1 Tax=Vaccinium darrowii TaxID=229202 RepID=A0ACB7XHJ9_9ERIC|nr:hypothetical protein Vadar_013206 [Vaccinium darrowii]
MHRPPGILPLTQNIIEIFKTKPKEKIVVSCGAALPHSPTSLASLLPSPPPPSSLDPHYLLVRNPTLPPRTPNFLLRKEEAAEATSPPPMIPVYKDVGKKEFYCWWPLLQFIAIRVIDTAVEIHPQTPYWVLMSCSQVVGFKYSHLLITSLNLMLTHQMLWRGLRIRLFHSEEASLKNCEQSRFASGKEEINHFRMQSVTDVELMNGKIFKVAYV